MIYKRLIAWIRSRYSIVSGTQKPGFNGGLMRRDILRLLGTPTRPLKETACQLIRKFQAPTHDSIRGID
jgi:hypothetical protein